MINESNRKLLKRRLKREWEVQRIIMIQIEEKSVEALEKYTDTIVTTSKGLKHLDRNINNRVSNLEKTSKGKIDDSKLFI